MFIVLLEIFLNFVYTIFLSPEHENQIVSLVYFLYFIASLLLVLKKSYEIFFP